MKKYAGGTKVGVGRSRTQIDTLLRNFGAQAVQWTDEWVPDRTIMIRFTWIHEETNLVARIRMTCDRERVGEDAIDGRSGKLSQRKLDKLLEQWDAEAHRLLLLFLKGAFYAIEAGIISAEQIFLPFFEDNSGRTVWEIMEPQIKLLPIANTMNLLTSGEG